MTTCFTAAPGLDVITTGFIDDRTGALFSSDCFGAVLPSAPTGAMLDVLPDGLAAVPGADRFEAPDQLVLEVMLSALSAPAGSPDLVPA